jgi:hypothetical protein
LITHWVNCVDGAHTWDGTERLLSPLSFQNCLPEIEVETATQGFRQPFHIPHAGSAPTLGDSPGSKSSGPFRPHIALDDVPAEQQTVVELRDPRGGFGGKEHFYSSGLSNLPPIVATGNGSSVDPLAEDAGEARHAALPLAVQSRAGEGWHAGGVRARVAADDMPATVKIPEFGLGHKARVANAMRGNKEMAAPSALLQKAGDGVVKVGSAIVEGQEDGAVYDIPLAGYGFW